MPYELPSIDGQVSRIVPTLTPGAVVTTTRAHVHYVITEYGTAMLFGRSTAQRARSLIAIAAPPVPRTVGAGRLRITLVS
jgi:4-hydroxybutyrate CoA-transferase